MTASDKLEGPECNILGSIVSLVTLRVYVCTRVCDCEISLLASPQHSSPHGAGEELTLTGELGRMKQVLWLMGDLCPSRVACLGASTASEVGTSVYRI